MLGEKFFETLNAKNLIFESNDLQNITISIGVIEACLKDNPDGLYQKIDGLMYKAK